MKAQENATQTEKPFLLCRQINMNDYFKDEFLIPSIYTLKLIINKKTL